MVVMGISLVLYMLLGGADFGAGIIEIFTGHKGIDTITKAMAPVWEANHMWLIIAIVILFNGFPKAYSILSTSLHIPVLIFLIAVVFRGAAFTFRHYDAYKDQSQIIYSNIFRYSSLVAVFFLGIIISAFFGGTIPSTNEGSFQEVFVFPWFNIFSVSTGCFVVCLSAYIAAVFLLGEVKTEDGYKLLTKFSLRLLVLAVLFGLAIFISSFWRDMVFHKLFFKHPFSVAAGVFSTLLIPFVYLLIKARLIWRLRLVVGLQILFVMAGWFILQWPNLVVFSDESTLTIYDAAGPQATMQVLFFALAIGVVIIFPGLYYLFRLFKTSN